ncbi:MAG: hypothetical protein WBM53_07480 [Maribacter sp.]
MRTFKQLILNIPNTVAYNWGVRHQIEDTPINFNSKIKRTIDIVNIKGKILYYRYNLYKSIPW